MNTSLTHSLGMRHSVSHLDSEMNDTNIIECCKFYLQNFQSLATTYGQNTEEFIVITEQDVKGLVLTD